MRIRTLGRFLGSVLDADDRKAIAHGVIILVALAVVVVVLAATAGLAFAIFEFVREV